MPHLWTPDHIVSDLSHKYFECFMKNWSVLSSSCNMGTSDLPEIYARARGRSLSARAYISDKSQVPMLQLIYSTWVTHLQVWETTGMLREYIYMGACEFRLWIML